MRRLALVLAGALAMGIALAAGSFGASSPNAGPRDAIWGGGHFTFDVTNERDFSLSAELGRFGQGGGLLVYGRVGGVARTDGVSCLAVSGNHAVVGGIDEFGSPYIIYAVDNGTPASATRDQVSPLQLLDSSQLAELPAGFPSVCPSPTSLIDGVSYTDLAGGDLVVRDVS